MALTLIQAGSPSTNYSSGTAGSVLPEPCGIGTCVAVLIQASTTTLDAVSSVTSSMGTFSRVNATAASGSDIEWWVCLDTTGASDAITVTTSGGVVWNAFGFEVYGGVASSVAGGSASAVGDTEPSLGVSCAVGDAVLVGGEMSPGTATPPSPWSTTIGTLYAGAMVAAWYGTPSTSVTATWGTSTANWATLGLVLTPDSPDPANPTLITPANASIVDVSSGVDFEATYNAAGADAMNAYALRIKAQGGSYSYWNAGTNALQSSIVWNSESVLANENFTVTLPSGVLSDGNVYSWSVACQDAVSGGQGLFATDYTFTAQSAPSVTVTAPSGTVGGTTSPTVQWTASPAPGTIQVSYSVIVESGSYGTTPGSGTLVWSSGNVVSGLNTAQIATPLSSGTTYRAFVQITQTGSQYSAWAYSTFTVSTDVPATPTISVVASTSSDTGCPVIAIEVQALDNYLSAVDSSFETGVGTWVPILGTCTLAQSSAEALDGIYSLAMTAAGSSIVAASGKYAVTASTAYSFNASFRAASTGRTCKLQAVWYDGATQLSTVTLSASTDATTGWTGGPGTATSPATANGVELLVTVESTVANEVHYLDCAGIFPTGSDLTWSLGGFVGLTSVVVKRSDNVFVRWASTSNPLPVPSAGQLAEVYDFEAIPGETYTYTAYVQQASVPLASDPVTSSGVSLTSTQWWELNPLAGGPTTNSSAVNAQMVDWTPIQTEQSTANQVLNQPHMNIVANAMMNQDFAGTVETFTDATFASFNALLTGQATVFISSPWGTIDTGYFRIGPQSGGMSSGLGNAAKNTKLLPSTMGSGHRTTQVTAVSQPRPSV